MKCPYCDNPLPPDAANCACCGAPTGVAPRTETSSGAAASDNVTEELQKLREEREKLRQLREEMEEEEYDDQEEYDDEYDGEDESEGPSEFGKFLHVAGWILIVVGIADFAGMFLGYDFTGYPWTPIAFGVVGEILINLDL